MGIVELSVLQALILTKDEQANIGRVLDKLSWLEKVIVLDSYSSDSTIEIIQKYSNVEIHYRKFDTFANQCNYGLSLLDSKWILSLDADYVLTDEFIIETKSFLMEEDKEKTAYFTKFKFLVFGKQLSSNNTTPRAVLFKKDCGTYFDDGHAHRLKIEGNTGFYKSCILHDDRKSLSVWLNNQDKYSIQECEKLLNEINLDQSSFTNKIRRTKVLAPIFIFFYCLLGKGLIFDGWHGWHYTLQRTIVEILFSLRLIEKTKLNN